MTCIGELSILARGFHLFINKDCVTRTSILGISFYGIQHHILETWACVALLTKRLIVIKWLEFFHILHQRYLVVNNIHMLLIYSLGMIIWAILTKQQPFCDR